MTNAKKTVRGAVAALSIASLLALAACSSETDPATGAGDTSPDAASTEEAPSETSADEQATSVTVNTNLGEVEIPLPIEQVVVLDNTAAQTLQAFGIEPIAVPKPLFPADVFGDWVNNDDILDVGSHAEPNLEDLSALTPDLIIGGYRFASFQDDLSRIGLTIDVAPNGGDSWLTGLRNQTTTLGEIFAKQDEAAALIADLDAAIARAQAATNGETVFYAIVSAGNVDNGFSRIGRLHEGLNLVNVLEAVDAAGAHGDAGIAPETLAELNPDWVIVLDRDAAVEDDYSPAQDLFAGQEAWANTTFTTKDQLIYLPNNFYTTEGIQAYTAVFNQIADAFEAAN